MENFGQKMKQAMANRGVQLEDVARATGVDIQHLEALERGDYDAVPDDARVTDLLRSFAEFVDVDGDAVIEDYLHDRQGRRPAPPRDGAGEAVQGVARAPRRRRSLAPVALALVALLASISWWWFRSAGRSEPPSATDTAPAGARAATEMAPPRQESDRAREAAPTPVPLIIAEHGVGTGVVDRQLVGEGDRFAEGTQVWFWTRVADGLPGETIRHVWLHEGREATGVTLALGGPQWRTQSAKTLNPGSLGSWAVEARDDSSRVLARREFLCVPRPAD